MTFKEWWDSYTLPSGMGGKDGKRTYTDEWLLRDAFEAGVKAGLDKAVHICKNRAATYKACNYNETSIYIAEECAVFIEAAKNPTLTYFGD